MSLGLKGLLLRLVTFGGEGGSLGAAVRLGESVPGCASAFLNSLTNTVLRSDPWSLGP